MYFQFGGFWSLIKDNTLPNPPSTKVPPVEVPCYDYANLADLKLESVCRKRLYKPFYASQISGLPANLIPLSAI